jgi:hypothetical protein
MEHRLSCYSFTRPRRSAQREGALPNSALHLTTARPQKKCAIAGERERLESPIGTNTDPERIN